MAELYHKKSKNWMNAPLTYQDFKRSRKANGILGKKYHYPEEQMPSPLMLFIIFYISPKEKEKIGTVAEEVTYVLNNKTVLLQAFTTGDKHNQVRYFSGYKERIKVAFEEVENDKENKIIGFSITDAT